jgi:hypothetical protein
MVSTLDFDSKDPSSNLGGTLAFFSLVFCACRISLNNFFAKMDESNMTAELLLFFKSQLVLIDDNKMQVPLIVTN